MTPTPNTPIHVYVRERDRDHNGPSESCIEVYWCGVQIYMGPTTALSAEAAGEAVRISLLRAMEIK